MGRKKRLTKAQVESLRADGKDAYAWEMKLPGFGVRKTRGGVVSFIVQYRDRERRSRRMALGRYPRLSVRAARRKAFKVMAAPAGGEPGPGTSPGSPHPHHGRAPRPLPR